MGSSKYVVVVIAFTLLAMGIGAGLSSVAETTTTVSIQVSGTPVEEPPESASPDSIVRQADLTAKQYSVVVDSMGSEMHHYRDEPELEEALSGAEYVQIDGQYYEITVKQGESESGNLLIPLMGLAGFLLGVVASVMISDV